LGRVDQPFDLVDGQVLPGPQGAIFLPAERLFDFWLA
jgi:hypothetical protein